MNIETGPVVEVSSTSIGASGGLISVSKPGTPVDGMEISIPAGAFSSSKTFSISYADIISHELGQYFDPISPMITIACDGGYSDEIMSLTIPVEIPEGHIAIGFYLDAVSGKLEGIPVESISSNSITLLTRHFLSGESLRSNDEPLKSASTDENLGANIIISSVSESTLNTQDIIASGFKPGENILGYYIVGWRSNSLNDDGRYRNEYIDFKWIRVYFSKLEISPNPIIGGPDQDLTITAKSYGSAPENAKYVWNFGDGSAEITMLNDSIVTHNFENTGDFQVELKLYDNSNNKLVSSATAAANIGDSPFENTEWRKTYQGEQSESIVFTTTTYSVYMGVGTDYHFTQMGGGNYVATGNTATLTPYGTTSSDPAIIEGDILTYLGTDYTKVK